MPPLNPVAHSVSDLLLSLKTRGMNVVSSPELKQYLREAHGYGLPSEVPQPNGFDAPNVADPLRGRRTADGTPLSNFNDIRPEDVMAEQGMTPARDTWFDAEMNPDQGAIQGQQDDLNAASQVLKQFAFGPNWNYRQIETYLNNMDINQQLEIADMLGFPVQSREDLQRSLPEMVNLLALSRQT